MLNTSTLFSLPSSSTQNSIVCDLHSQSQPQTSTSFANNLTSNNLTELTNSNKNLKEIVAAESLDTNFFQCLICGNFSSSELADMLEHLDMDRSRLYSGDIQVNFFI